MSDLFLYLGITIVGYIIGDRCRKANRSLSWTGKVQTVAISALVFGMGLRIGGNKEIVQQLDTIGLYALAFTILVLVFSVLCVFLTRKALGINRYGLMENDEVTASAGTTGTESGEPATETVSEISGDGTLGEDHSAENREDGSPANKHKIDPMTLIILGFVAAGIAVGYFGFALRLSDFDTFNRWVGLAVKLGLCLLLIFVGMDIGAEGKVVAHFKKVGLRILAIPIAITVGTLVAAAISTLFIPVGLKESLAIGAGFGWYTLAPGIIMDNGYMIAGAISFMHNVMRELIGILTIPLVARHIGYVECCALPGASAMDVSLPIVERATSGTTAIYSFVSGAFLSMAVPILVTIIIA